MTARCHREQRAGEAGCGGGGQTNDGDLQGAVLPLDCADLGEGDAVSLQQRDGIDLEEARREAAEDAWLELGLGLGVGLGLGLRRGLGLGLGIG